MLSWNGQPLYSTDLIPEQKMHNTYVSSVLNRSQRAVLPVAGVCPVPNSHRRAATHCVAVPRAARLRA